MYVGTDYTPYYSGDYHVSWSIQQGYAKMQVKVQAYNAWDIYLGCDTQYVINFIWATCRIIKSHHFTFFELIANPINPLWTDSKQISKIDSMSRGRLWA